MTDPLFDTEQWHECLPPSLRTSLTWQCSCGQHWQNAGTYWFPVSARRARRHLETGAS